MVVIEVVVCNKCRSVGKPVTRYTVRPGGGAEVELAFCAEHDALAEWLSTVETVRQPAPAAKTRRAARKNALRSRVTTVEDIEASKQ